MVALQAALVAMALSGVGETVLLKFEAPWCGPCHAMEPVVQRLAQQGYPIRKVNIDNQPDMAARYGVRSVPCFVLLVNGDERGRLVGGTSYERLEQLFAEGGVRRPGRSIATVRGQSPERRRRTAESIDSLQPPVVEMGQPVDPRQWERQRLAAKSRAAVPPAGARKAGGIAKDPLTARLLAASVRIRIDDPQGRSYGSGTIIDSIPPEAGRQGEALILTCGHIFRESQGKGRITVDVFGPQGPVKTEGHLIRYDLKRDIGLLSIRIDRPMPSIEMIDAGYQLRRGERVVSIGCGGGKRPSEHWSQIMAVNSFVGPPNLQVAGQPEVGRSGGGLFTPEGKIVGVCNFADPTERAGLFAAVESAKQVLDDAGLARIYRGATPGSVNSEQLVSVPPRERPNRAAVPVNRAIGDQSGTEVICIVRAKQGNGRGDELFVIRDASSDLLRRLSEAQRSNLESASPVVETGGRQPASTGTIHRSNPWRGK